MLSRVLEPEAMDTPEEARTYDEMDHEAPNKSFCADLCALSPRPDLSRTLDVGTGTARIPVLLCGLDPRARVVGLDLAACMLALAARNVELAALSGAIVVERADGKAMPYADGAFSAVLSNTILHHVPDPAPVMREAARVLARGGWLFVRDLVRPATDADVGRLVALHAANATAHGRALLDASLRAAFTLDEVAALCAAAGLPPSAVSQTSDRHWTLAWRKAVGREADRSRSVEGPRSGPREGEP